MGFLSFGNEVVCYSMVSMKIVIGIDEVGRGPIAGPTAVAAFVLSGKIKSPQLNGKPVPMRDSKKLTRGERECWYAEISRLQKEGKCAFSVTMISAKEIDRIGIAVAIRKALAVCLVKIGANSDQTILLDGSLYAPKEFKRQKTIIKGDEKEQSIALASIAAKVTRDRHMLRMAKKFPQFGFETHVGYGTKKHYAAIKKHGLCPLHRKSFLKSF